MRELIAIAALGAFISSAEAQQARPPGQPPKPPAQAAQRTPAPPAPPPIFPCRTAEEVCFLGVVTGPRQVAVLFTNAEKADGIDEKPVEVSAGDPAGGAGGAAPMDLTPHMGRIVMLTGTYDTQAGLTKAELVEVASPLVSLTIKAQLSAEEPEPQAAGKPQPKPRR